jgi:hypothetical protein
MPESRRLVSNRRLIAGSLGGVMLLCAAMIPAASFGQCDTSWTGGSGNWNPGSWSAGLPTQSTSACITTPSTTVTLNIVGATNTYDASNFFLGSGDALSFADGTTLDLFGPTLSNSGSMTLNAASSTTALELGAGQTLTISGGGSIALSNNASNVIYGAGATLINQETIQGSGTIGGANGIGNTEMVLMNSGTINANQSLPLQIDAAEATGTNTGTIEATRGAALVLYSSLANTGGTILATGSNSTVQLAGATVSGGTLSTSAGGGVLGETGSTLDGTTTDTLTITAGSTFEQVNGDMIYVAGTITNNGSILMDGTTKTTILEGTGTEVTLAGTGTLTMANSTNNKIQGPGATFSFINDETIQGSGYIGWGKYISVVNNGVIDANQSSVLEIKPDDGFTNKGTVEATNGATLELYKYHMENASGTILASGANSQVQINAATLMGGMLSTSSGGLIVISGGATLDGAAGLVTLTSGSSMQIPDSQVVYLDGTFTDDGTLTLDSSGGVTEISVTAAGTTLNGTGTLSLSNNSNNQITGTSGSSLTTSVTIQGSGNLGNTQIGLLNQGTIHANQSVPLIIDPSSTGKFQNQGTLQVDAGSTLQITGSAGGFRNFNPTTGTLTAGTYNVTGTLQLSTPNSKSNNIVTDAASITLTGTTSQILNQSNGNALATLASVTSKGSFTLAGNQSFTSAGAFSNAGAVKVSSGSTFTVAGGGSYTQTGGTTTVDGTLATSSTASFRSGSMFPIGAGSISFNGGSVFGNGGNLSADVSSSAALTPADSATTTGALGIGGNYTQNSTGALNIRIASATAYNQLAISGSATLGGTLNIGRLGGYVPPVGATFTILTAGSVAGQFATVKGTGINGSEHFVVNYNAASVMLTVASGAL